MSPADYPLGSPESRAVARQWTQQNVTKLTPYDEDASFLLSYSWWANPEVKAGRATRRYRGVKSDGANELVFQSVKDGKPIRDNNIRSRFIKPAARNIGLPWVNWRSLRTSHAVWLKLAGADVKDAQGQMRRSRASTTLHIYQQFVPESQQKVLRN